MTLAIGLLLVAAGQVASTIAGVLWSTGPSAHVLGAVATCLLIGALFVVSP